MENVLSSERIKRTILYYPTISIPSGNWFRKALLYFDEVASIVPSVVSWSGEVGDALVPLTPEVRYLEKEGAFRRVPPEVLFMGTRGWDPAHEFLEEFKSAVVSEPFMRLLDLERQSRQFVRVHKGKLGYGALDYLEERDLVRFDKQHPRDDPDWYLVEEKTALLYLSLLAKSLADFDKEKTVPGTDRREYENLIYDASTQDNGFACLDTRFRNVLPIPRDDVPLADILAFKKRRSVELLHFQQQIDQLQHQLSEAQEQQEVTDALLSFSDSLHIELSNLTNVLHDARIATVAGAFKCLINVKSPTALLASLGSAVGILGGPVGLHISIVALPIALPVLAMFGSIEVGCHLIDKKNEARAKTRDHPFAYLYHAREEGLLPRQF